MLPVSHTHTQTLQREERFRQKVVDWIRGNHARRPKKFDLMEGERSHSERFKKRQPL